jgi:hypothetical protein
MKRFHLHVSVGNLDESIRFYSTLFAAQPAVRQSDYAKWMLEDPRINFAIVPVQSQAATGNAPCCVPATKSEPGNDRSGCCAG